MGVVPAVPNEDKQDGGYALLVLTFFPYTYVFDERCGFPFFQLATHS
jgi:hypothetical protein